MITVDIKKKDLSGGQILGEVAFTLSAGETLAISGPSGVGKTTLLRILAGLDPSFDGSILGAKRIAMVFQEPVLLPWRSSLAKTPDCHGPSDPHARGGEEAGHPNGTASWKSGSA